MSELATYLSDSVRQYATALPWFLPGVALALVLGVPLSRPLARLLAARRAVTYLLVVSIGAILAATLPPGAGSFDRLVDDHGGCHLHRFALADAHDYLSVSEPSLNVLLFMPLGIALALLPRTRATLALTVGAFALPVAIEALQLALPALGRACASGDVVDNLIGLVIGLAIGSAAGLGGRLLRGSTHARTERR